jgi:RimJ/RimL family protein N-acetyltransferase
MWPGALGGPRSWEQTREWLGRYEGHWATHGFGLWTARERRGGAVVAHAGLAYTVVEGRAEVEVGFVVHPDRWGRGYATELTRAALGHAHGIRGLRSVVGFALVGNEPAMAVLRRCGFALEGPAEVVGLPHALFRRAVG